MGDIILPTFTEEEVKAVFDKVFPYSPSLLKYALLLTMGNPIPLDAKYNFKHLCGTRHFLDSLVRELGGKSTEAEIIRTFISLAEAEDNRRSSLLHGGLLQERYEALQDGKITEDEKQALLKMKYRYDPQTKVHYIDDTPLFIEKNGDCIIKNYKDGIYALENIKGNEKSKQIYDDILGYNEKSNRIYDIFGYIARILGINNTIDIGFFRNDSNYDIIKKLIQVFRIITGFTGQILLFINKQNSNSWFEEYLMCYDCFCCFQSSKIAG